MSPETIAALIGVGTFFFTCLGNALILGIYLGGIRAEMSNNNNRLAKIEGMFTLVPIGQNQWQSSTPGSGTYGEHGS